jgi:hypothetical protein
MLMIQVERLQQERSVHLNQLKSVERVIKKRKRQKQVLLDALVQAMYN